MEGDLNSLLDDALGDFDKPPASIDNSSLQSDNSNEPSASNVSAASFQPPTELFKEFFDDDIAEKLQTEWNMAMKELNAESSASDACKQNSDSSNAGFNATMNEALQSMSKELDEDITQETMQSFLNLGLSGPSSAEEIPALNMMEDLMKSMLSKDMLYPPMKEMCKKYPGWLESHSNSITNSQRKKYENQLICLQKICNEFECENDKDSDEVKKERFSRIMETINTMQQYGQPPEALLTDQKSPELLSPEGCMIS